MTKRVAIIGAGVSGLAAARVLRGSGASCVIFDKSRGLGGRMSTRRVGDLTFDHGAQYFTARGPRFAALVEEWRSDGVAAHWFGEAIVGSPGMTAPARAMAQGFEAVMGFEVTSLRRESSGWSLVAGEASHGGFDAVIVATPAPQAAPILATGGASFPALASVRYAPCLALMLAFDGPVAFEGGHLRPETGPIAWIARNSSKPDRKDSAETFVVHAGPEWSRAQLDETPEAILEKLKPYALDLIGAPSAPIYAAAHRWRYALVEQAAGASCFWDAQAGLGACGDYCLGPRVEAAFDSGEAMAQAVLESWACISQPDPKLTVYYDGACPLCRAEIGHYSAQEGAGAICFLDVSTPTSDLPPGLTREQALARFHVRRSDGRVASGAEGFVEVWGALPRWRWAARLSGLPGVTPLLEFAYRLFLPVRPWLSKAFGKLKS